VNRRSKHPQIPLNPDPTANLSPPRKWKPRLKKGFSRSIYIMVPKPYHFFLRKRVSIPSFPWVSFLCLSDLHFRTTMGKGPGLYSDIGKKARGSQLWIICVYVCICVYVMLGFCGLIWGFKFCFGYILFGFRSSVQGLPERPQVHHHYLFFHWSCKLFCFL